MHESQMHGENCFATFTYRPKDLPADLSLVPEHFTLFMKRFRERLRKPSGEAEPTPRYYMCGEYGDVHSRPHYHALLFGYSPPDKRFYKCASDGSQLYTSEFLDSVWQKGQVIVGAVTFESAAYVARYIMKKELGANVSDAREILDVETGEITFRAHEYSRRSLKPGLGASWFAKYRSDVFPHDRVLSRGVKSKVPKYYDVLLERDSPLYLAELKALRRSKADVKDYEEQVRDRVAGDVVLRARLGLLHRELE